MKLPKRLPADGAAYTDTFAKKIHPAALNKDLRIPNIGKFRNCVDDLPELASVSFTP